MKIAQILSANSDKRTRDEKTYDIYHRGIIDEAIFEEAVRLLAPDLVLIILGTNDHNIGGFSKEQFAANLEEIIRRIKAGHASAQTMLVSTFRSNTQAGQPGGLLDEYKSYSYPQAAENSGSKYWDMSTYFEDKYGKWAGGERNQEVGYYQGEPTYAYPPYIMLDNYHVGFDGAGYIADELWFWIATRYGNGFLNAP